MRNHAHADRCNRVVHSHRSTRQWSHLGWFWGESEQSVLHGVKTSCFLNKYFLPSRMSQVRTRLTFSNSQTAHRLTAPMRPFTCCNATTPTALIWICGHPTSLTWNSSITKLEGSLRFMKLVSTKFASSNSDWLMSDGVCSRILLTPLSISEGSYCASVFSVKGQHFEQMQ